jgi:AraC family transcriptional regulator of adaptative response/methylated-DNA-[protein]-cysteine methyltransferase
MPKHAPAPLEQRARTYARMASALAGIGDTWRDWPDLTQLARRAGLSPAHFQREFALWAGLSPKQFQGALAHGAAGEMLRGGASVLEASLETGLSGPARLHDLFIAHEALTPGEAKAGGSGAELVYGRAPTPFGEGAWLLSPRGLVALGFIDEAPIVDAASGHGPRGEDAAFEDLLRRYPKASARRDDAAAGRFARQVFEDQAPVPVCLYGSPFRRQIWRALLDIPPGRVETYGSIAARCRHPRAARATGAAIGANPVSWFIPCHRALAADGRLHNYHWGVARKRAMLAYETAQALPTGG